MIRKITELQCCKTDLTGDLFPLLVWVPLRDVGRIELGSSTFGDEAIKSASLNTPPSRVLKGVPSGPFTVPNRCVPSRRRVARYPSCEQLETPAQMETLTCINHVQHEVGIEFLDPHLDGCKVGGRIQIAAVGAGQKKRRQFLGILWLRHIDDDRTLGFASLPRFKESGDHRCEAVVNRRLPVPDIEFDIERFKV